MGWRERGAAWCAERYRAEGLKDLVTHKTVPVHRYSFWYYFGGVTLFLFGIQLITGILLLLYYKPTTQAAFESVRFIMTRVEFGWLVRSLHAWSANMMILSAMAHLVSVFLLKAYRPPRELTWVVGVAAFFLLLGFGFTGYLLPWNTLSFFATKVGTEIAGSTPLVGPFLRLVLRGGEEVGDATLGRFFAVHVVVLPLVVLGVMGVHLAMVQLQGMSVPPSIERKGGVRGIPFFPNFFLRDLVAWTIAFGVVVSLAVYFPAELGQKADPFAPTPAGIRPEWYFLWMFQTLKLLPSRIGFLEGELAGIGLVGMAMAALVFLPFLDKRLQRGRPNPLVVGVGLVALAYVIAMTVWGMVR